LCGVADVRLNPGDLTTKFLDSMNGFGGFGLTAARNDHPCTFSGESQCSGPSDTGTTASHQGNFAFHLQSVFYAA
jgi:hypothetical protein